MWRLPTWGRLTPKCRINVREGNLCSFPPELTAYSKRPVIHHLPIPRGCDSDARREDADKVCRPEGRRAILEAEPAEVEAWDRVDIADAGTGLSGHHISLLLEGELGNKSPGFLQCLLPATCAGDLGCTVSLSVSERWPLGRRDAVGRQDCNSREG